jgi:hypothetical protein
MLGFRALNTDYNLVEYTPGPSITGNIVIFSVNTVDDPKWTYVNLGLNAFNVRSVPANVNRSTYTSYAATGAGATNYSITSATGGAHNYNVNSGPSTRLSSANFQDVTDFTRNHSGHTHFATNLFSNVTPQSVGVAMYQAASTIGEIPPGVIVFAADVNVNLSKIASNTSYNDLHLAVTSNSLISSAYSNTVSSVPTVSSSGGHTHTTSGTLSMPGVSSPTAEYVNYATETGTAHVHTVSSFNISSVNTYAIKLRTWITTDYCPVSNGMIFAWNANSSQVPAKWYSCNGQIINGYTTPNLDNRFIICGNNTTHSTLVNSGNTISWPSFNTSTDDWTHAHGTETNFYNAAATVATIFHASFNVLHSHSFNSGSATFLPRRQDLAFYIYLP